MSLDLSRVRFHWLEDTGVPGVLAIVALHPLTPVPLGMLWFRFCSRRNEVEIVDSYVREEQRRQGIRTRMNTWLLQSYPDVKRIITFTGTRAGATWMKASGYTHHKEGHWSVTRAVWNRMHKEEA